MELGEVYKENGEISHEKLFYYHFRKAHNSHSFREVEGNEIISVIENEHREKIKEQYNVRLFDLEGLKYHDIEKILILFTEEVFVSNANNLDYFFGQKRVVTDEILQKLAIEHDNRDSPF